MHTLEQAGAREVDTASGSPAQPGGALRLLGTLLTALAVVLLAAFAAKAVGNGATAAQMWAYPFQFDESEGMIVAETQLLDRGVPIYNNLTPDLFIAAPYPPLYYLLNLPGQHLLGSAPTFKAGRTITLLATLFVGVAIAGIIASLGGDRLAGAIGAAAWWSLGLVMFWGSLVKPDMVAVALGLAGLWWLLARPPKQVWWALPFFLAAFYTKQTGIAAAVAGVGWLLFTRPRTGLRFGIIYVAGAILPTAALIALTNGGYYYHEGAFRLPGLPDPVHSLPWMGDRFLLYVGNFLSSYAPILLPGMLALLVAGAGVLARRWACWRGRLGAGERVARTGPLLLLLYLLMSVVVASGTGTLGGNHNHLLDWAAAGCIGLGLGVSMLRGAARPGVRPAGAAAGVLLLVLLPGLFGAPEWLREEFSPLQAEKQEGMMSIFQYVTNNGGPAYSDNVGLMLTTHKQLWTTDPYTQTHATFYKRWDESKLVEAMQHKAFSQVILRIDIFEPQPGAGDISPGVLQALRDNYKLDQRNVENIYVPR